jgi:dihydroorotase-like cyclic amidohydrolase
MYLYFTVFHFLKDFLKYTSFFYNLAFSLILVQLEGEATARAIRLAGFVNTPLYVVHVMSIDAMEEIAKARKSGLKFLIFHFLVC